MNLPANTFTPLHWPTSAGSVPKQNQHMKQTANVSNTSFTDRILKKIKKNKKSASQKFMAQKMHPTHLLSFKEKHNSSG